MKLIFPTAMKIIYLIFKELDFLGKNYFLKMTNRTLENVLLRTEQIPEKTATKATKKIISKE